MVHGYLDVSNNNCRLAGNSVVQKYSIGEA